MALVVTFLHPDETATGSQIGDDITIKVEPGTGIRPENVYQVFLRLTVTRIDDAVPKLVYEEKEQSTFGEFPPFDPAAAGLRRGEYYVLSAVARYFVNGERIDFGTKAISRAKA